VPTVFTPSCSKKPPGVIDLYEPRAVELEFRDGRNEVFILHGISALPTGSSNVPPYFLENVPVFAGAQAGVTNLTRAQITSILKGDVTDWSQLGGAPGPVHVYLHGGSLQRQSFNKFLEILDLSPKDLRAPALQYGENYDALSSLSETDPQAFVIGLKDVHPPRLHLLDVEGRSLLVRHAEGYPLTIPVYVYSRKTPKATALTQDILKEISLWRLDTDTTPTPP
jgi:hypothetical protein